MKVLAGLPRAATQALILFLFCAMLNISHAMEPTLSPDANDNGAARCNMLVCPQTERGFYYIGDLSSLPYPDISCIKLI